MVPLGPVACVDGAAVACEEGAPEAACGQCYLQTGPDSVDVCPDDSYCDLNRTAAEPGVCLPELAMGMPCVEHRECASANCSAQEGRDGVCQAAAGTPCTGTECDWCDPSPSGGGEICIQNCQTDTDCASNEHCVGNRVEQRFACRRDCDGSGCPSGYECRLVSDGSFSFCGPQ